MSIYIATESRKDDLSMGAVVHAVYQVSIYKVNASSLME